MTPRERIEEALHRLEIYVSEHGQGTGMVSWQMAQDSVKTLLEEFKCSEQMREMCALIAFDASGGIGEYIAATIRSGEK